MKKIEIEKYNELQSDLHYQELCTALDGKKYLEAVSCKEDFHKNRHKKSCIKNGTMRTYDKKVDGTIYSVCRECGYEIQSNCPHFPEDETVGSD